LLLSHVVLPFSSTNTAPSSIYTLSLHDALPICDVGDQNTDALFVYAKAIVEIASDGAHGRVPRSNFESCEGGDALRKREGLNPTDRKSTRLNSSHVKISYAVFCLKKKNKNKQ